MDRNRFGPKQIISKLWEAKVPVEKGGKEYNQPRPHSALGYQPQAPEATKPLPIGMAV
jgi:hypothetical protein